MYIRKVNVAFVKKKRKKNKKVSCLNVKDVARSPTHSTNMSANNYSIRRTHEEPHLTYHKDAAEEIYPKTKKNMTKKK